MWNLSGALSWISLCGDFPAFFNSCPVRRSCILVRFSDTPVLTDYSHFQFKWLVGIEGRNTALGIEAKC